MSKFSVSMVFSYEFDIGDAIHILSDPSPKDALQDYMVRTHGVKAEGLIGNYNSGELRKALGDHLADSKIEEARQIPLSTGGAS